MIINCTKYGSNWISFAIWTRVMLFFGAHIGVLSNAVVHNHTSSWCIQRHYAMINHVNITVVNERASLSIYHSAVRDECSIRVF